MLPFIRCSGFDGSSLNVQLKSTDDVDVDVVPLAAAHGAEEADADGGDGHRGAPLMTVHFTTTTPATGEGVVDDQYAVGAKSGHLVCFFILFFSWREYEIETNK